MDADQIIREDLRKLVDMDLHGAPYAYTPFCDNNKDMDGYRFWNSGFWKSHLQGRPYHISALYVVDLKRFRETAAGDQLRVIYDQLSKVRTPGLQPAQSLPRTCLDPARAMGSPPLPLTPLLIAGDGAPCRTPIAWLTWTRTCPTTRSIRWCPSHAKPAHSSCSQHTCANPEIFALHKRSPRRLLHRYRSSLSLRNGSGASPGAGMLQSRW